MAHSKDSLERYSRHLALEDFSIKDQEKLFNSSILIIGLGALASPICHYLPAVGIGELTLMDKDTVNLSNLPRQTIYNEKDINRKKTDAVKEKISSINSQTKVKVINKFFEEEDEDIIKNYDFIIDASDNFETKYLINDICVKYKKPYSYSSILAYKGYIYTYNPSKKYNLRSFFPKIPKNITLNCLNFGVLGVVPALLGTLQATECIKYLLGKGEILDEGLLKYDALKMTFEKHYL